MAYGFMTRSYLRSTEHRQMKQERERITREYQPGKVVEFPMACTCRYKPFPRLGHNELSRDNDWRERK